MSNDEKTLILDETYRGVRYQIYKIHLHELEEAAKRIKKSLGRTALRSTWIVVEHDPKDEELNSMIKVASIGTDWDDGDFLYHDTMSRQFDNTSIEHQIEVGMKWAHNDIDRLLAALKVKE